MSEYYDNSNDGRQVDEEKLLNGAIKIEEAIDAALDKETSSIITRRSVIAGIICLIPLGGFETIIYAFCLWSMYGKIAQKAKTPFKDHLIKNIISGFIVNIVIVWFLNWVCDLFGITTFGLTWILAFVIGFLATKMSGLGFVAMMKAMHGQKAKIKLDLEAGVDALLSSKDKEQVQENVVPPQITSNTINNGIQQPPQINVPSPQPLMQTPPPRPAALTVNPNLLTCPDCGRKVSKHAECCPECGCPVSEMK